METALGWVEFKQKYPKQAEKLMVLYTHFLSFPGNCIFYIYPDHIVAKDIINLDTPWIWREYFNDWILE